MRIISDTLTCNFAGVLVLTVAIAARAEEGGAGHYTPGSFASFVDVLPGKPGIGPFNYLLYYNGKGSASCQFPNVGEMAAHVAVSSCSESFGAFWVTPLEILGAYYAPGIAPQFVSTDVKLRATPPGGGTVGMCDSASNLGDIEFFPASLSWTAGNTNLHVDFFAGIYAPSGGFQKNALVNPGLGYWSLEPGVLFSYLNQKNGIEFSSYVGHDINSRNTRTDYQSGQQFHVDATVAQHLPLGKGFIGIGASGFYLQQTSGDRGGGAPVGGFEEVTAGIGPVVSYGLRFAKASFAVEVKWLPQIEARNTLKGDYIWFKVSVQF